MSNRLLGAVEAGGTKMACAVAREPDKILEETRFPTSEPEGTFAQVDAFFTQAEAKHGRVDALGYGTFGPAGVNPAESTYGQILKTPKDGWEGVDVLGFLREKFPKTKLAFDTDVNAAALGEGRYGAAQGLQDFIYITVGTGIGGGVVIDGKPLHAQPHAEIGHMRVPLLEGELDDFPGSCQFHGRCLEGLASGTAIGARWGIPATELPKDHPAWDLEAGYLAAMVQNLVACFAPQKIILGGGVMNQKFLLGKVKARYLAEMAGYWSGHEDLLVLPELGNQAGITGALIMASSA
ncbi:ROK family protein [Verrucomicrobiaceae bacterium 5K15]|uniref:fructokinase n=1 Tax=Oceaniferula flava TaxID=2800421 RepID=A0AAE2VBB1_9BACT|nr:ROK family protein [Oceaniferula flavus]MBK1853541.1 ROK family protein [Oceaniferula flavus]MBM1134846.1 ROK family protein [Oceaniferula flavus]